ncbi:MAG: hypothetical protein Q8O30_00340 [Candidatus Omnitrophota bacterium]|nr:hypothetical protein [Candidatus Omnitrophota bacterium]
MLDREVVREFLEDKSKVIFKNKPKDISGKILVETFCRYIEDDYYEWLKDNFKTFFNHGMPDWNWIKERIRYYK